MWSAYRLFPGNCTLDICWSVYLPKGSHLRSDQNRDRLGAGQPRRPETLRHRLLDRPRDLEKFSLFFSIGSKARSTRSRAVGRPETLRHRLLGRPRDLEKFSLFFPIGSKARSTRGRAAPPGQDAPTSTTWPATGLRKKLTKKISNFFSPPGALVGGIWSTAFRGSIREQEKRLSIQPLTDSAKMKSKSRGFRWYSVDYIVRIDLAKEKELHLGTLTESAKKKSSCFEKN